MKQRYTYMITAKYYNPTFYSSQKKAEEWAKAVRLLNDPLSVKIWRVPITKYEEVK